MVRLKKHCDTCECTNVLPTIEVIKENDMSFGYCNFCSWSSSQGYYLKKGDGIAEALTLMDYIYYNFDENDAICTRTAQSENESMACSTYTLVGSSINAISFKISNANVNNQYKIQFRFLGSELSFKDGFAVGSSQNFEEIFELCMQFDSSEEVFSINITNDGEVVDGTFTANYFISKYGANLEISSVEVYVEGLC